MKHIKYERMLNSGSLQPVTIDYNEINERIAIQESFGGAYTVEKDGDPVPTDRVTELEEAIALLLSGVVE